MSEQTGQQGNDAGYSEAIPESAASALRTDEDVDVHGGSAAQRTTLQNPNGEVGIPEEEDNLRLILDIPVTVSVEIGRTRLPIRTLLQLNQGSVVELERIVGEPLDVLVNGTLIAHGEVVVINEKYGIRLTDVISPSERVRKLR